MDEDEKKPEPPKWEHRELGINQKMKELCKAAIKSTEGEIQVLAKKLKKLQYGG